VWLSFRDPWGEANVVSGVDDGNASGPTSGIARFVSGPDGQSNADVTLAKPTDSKLISWIHGQP